MVRRHLLLLVALAALIAQRSVACAQPLKPHEYLQAATAPNFHAGHTLPRLTRWGWNLSYDATVELAERWGYTLELAGYLTPAAVDDINNNPAGHNARLVALSRSNPERYPLSVLAHRPLVHQAATMPAELLSQYYVREASGRPVVDPLTGGPSWRTVSPEAPDAVFEWAAAQQTAPLAALRAKTPIAMVLSGGEYGVSVYGHSGAFWQQDPSVLAAKGGESWYEYASQRKAHTERIVTEAARQAVPDRELYLYYTTDGAGDRGAYANWWQWRHEYAETRGISDIANTALYYKHANTGFTGSRDMLTAMLNATAQQHAFGDALSYNWVNGGYKSDFSDPQRYMGFLKACYTAGMIGGVAGYFAMPPGGFDADIQAGATPTWLTQVETLSHVHGTFSYLEKYLREGTLLPGPNRHAWSTDLPAYELPTGDATARVLARKLNGHEEWLVTAWAADGPDRSVTTYIDGLGSVDLLARGAGSVYLLALSDLGLQQRLLDADPMLPSARLNMITATADAGGVISWPGSSVALDGDAFSLALELQDGYRLVDVLVDGQSMGADAVDYTLDEVSDSHTIHFNVAAVEAIANGDLDGDGVVDGEDLSTWQSSFSGDGAQRSGDVDGDADIDGHDFLAWQRRVGNSTGSVSSVMIPEPVFGSWLPGLWLAALAWRYGVLAPDGVAKK